MSAEGARNELAEALKAEARRRGFALAGLAPAAPSEHADFFRSWLAEAHHGEMAYLARDDAVARRADVSRTQGSARSVLVVAHEYGQDDPPGVPDDPGRGVIARYARGRDYHKVVKNRLDELRAWLQEEASARGITDRIEARAYVDTGPILERELARRAGLGWFGKNTMLIHPRRGSWFFLGVLLLDLDLPPDDAFEPDHCGTCRRCLDACPTGALKGRDESGAPVIDARLCISYLTIELKGPIPHELRPAIGNRVFGCDICQEVCPFNVRFAEETDEPGYAARGPGDLPFGVEALPGEDVSAETSERQRTHPGTASPSLVELLETALDENAWDSFSRGSAIRRAGRAGFARNVCIGLGNWGSAEAVPVLKSALSDPEPLVRSHAAWALGRVGSAEARAALSSRASVEPDERVRSEIGTALDA